MNDKFYLPATLAVCALMLATWYFLVCEPARLEIRSMELETQRLLAAERSILEFKAHHGDLAALAEAKALQLDEARIFLPTTPAQDKFIDELYRAAELCDVRIISVRAGEVTSDEELQTQVVSVRADANYISMLNFVRNVLDGERLTALESISLTNADGSLVGELSLKIFAATR